MLTFWEMILLVIIIICLIVFVIGPPSRRACESIKYEELLKLVADKKIRLKIQNYRIAGEIATSSVYPQNTYRIYRFKVCLFRVIFLLYLAILWYLPQIDAGEIVIALIIRYVSLQNLSNDVMKTALKNEKVYQAVVALDGWEYIKITGDSTRNNY